MQKISTFLKRYVGEFDLDAVTNAKVWIMMSILSIALILAGHAMGRFGLLFGFFAALSLNCVVFFYADLRLVALFPGRSLEGQDPWGALTCVKDLSRRAGLRTPALRLIFSHTPLVFSAGLMPSQSVISISTALVEKLTPIELKIVLAFEISRLKSRTTATSTAVSALVGLLTLMASTVDEILLLRFLTRWSARARARRAQFLKHGGVRVGPATLLISPLAALIIRLTISRRSILNADKEIMELARVPSSDVARTLWKLDSFVKTRPFPVNLAEAHLFMVSPLARYPFWRFASAQPPTSVRLKNLTGHAPL